jgi:hypothetical protein
MSEWDGAWCYSPCRDLIPEDRQANNEVDLSGVMEKKNIFTFPYRPCLEDLTDTANMWQR